MSRLLLASSLLVLALLAGCASDDESSRDPTPSPTPTQPAATASPSGSSSTTPSSPPSPRPAQTVPKDVTDNAFPEGTFTLQKGDKVVWTHRGTNIHTVSTTSGSVESFDSHPNCPPVCLLGGQTFEHTFETLGDVTYHCKIHGGMTGTITVVQTVTA